MIATIPMLGSLDELQVLHLVLAPSLCKFLRSRHCLVCHPGYISAACQDRMVCWAKVKRAMVGYAISYS